MSYGLGQSQWQFASPDFPQGSQDYATIVGNGEQGPFAMGGPYTGGDPDTTQGVGPVHVATGASAPGTAGRAQHWSNLLDWRHGPMFWLASPSTSARAPATSKSAPAAAARWKPRPRASSSSSWR
jgi:hypothetical protein